MAKNDKKGPPAPDELLDAPTAVSGDDMEPMPVKAAAPAGPTPRKPTGKWVTTTHVTYTDGNGNRKLVPKGEYLVGCNDEDLQGFLAAGAVTEELV